MENQSQDELWLPTPDCCSVWPDVVWAFDWLVIVKAPHLVTMPYLQEPNTENRILILFCPSCGAPRRDVMMERERLADLIF